MTPTQVASLVVLAGILVISILRKVNIGIVALAATLVMITATHTDVTKTLSKFPASLVILIIGVTLLFAHAERSGAINWLVGHALRWIGNRHWLIPWGGFFLGAALSTIGAFPTAPISLLLPILAKISRSHRLNYLPMAVVCVLGSNAAGLSPLSPAGALIQTLIRNAGLTYSPWELYGVVMLMHIVIAAAILVFVGVRQDTKVPVPVLTSGSGLLTDDVSDSAQPSPADAAPADAGVRPACAQRYLYASLASLIAFVIITVAFKLDVGLTAVTLAFLLQIVFRPPEKELLSKVPWNVVLLLGGLVIYLSLLDTLGTIKAIESALAGIGSAALLILVVSYTTGLISNMESSTLGVLGVMVPVALTVAGHSPTGVTAVLVAVVMSGAVVVMSPLHIAGALIIANTPDNNADQVFRRLLIWSVVLTIVIPGIAALYPILLG
ncbi:putative dicarboxylate carrier protein [Gordonia polyisoprenivorans VH2]|uniref:Putative dicarboxylate carrier protein n=1 Tax=Gordonia polyisoprenivorans (strain DSM 44266 / VH2) TaxID=1112204 RepID=H6MWQ4_GORPV|nr:SLC13 family permease [Gordonia polyisoprenivorans]AFA75465.1 putative dicarboxylate carrier protein [Gordonia polyisoprenivorans VH2]MBE7195968.1 C4-dicarboxylate ABC transporter [Gordonia polyisoprenivorans]OZC32384.1 hypothetical protein CJJ17_13420 [Gordonia polyisoprenivorans]UZF55773.1 C4-dicarboxylate ABC transporter [Gordonia polyisoprenivorans]